MAGKTVHAVVRVTADLLVLVVHARLGMLVTVQAREAGVVGRVRVAFVASVPLAPVLAGIDRETVVERRSVPIRGVVAGLATGRETGGAVIRVRDGVVFVAVARVAACGRAAEGIVDVTVRAGDVLVGAGQRERGRAVIELRSVPLRGAVAKAAVLRKSRGRVIWTRSSVVVIQVAGTARRAEAGELAVGVTRVARHRCVRPGERKSCGGVIESRSLPGRRRVTHRAVLGKAGGDVVWIPRVVEIGLVAGNAVAGRAGKLVPRVAFRALGIAVSAR